MTRRCGEALVFLLASRGVRAEGFASAEEFLSRFDGQFRGCALTDMRMGGMSGLELFDRLAIPGSQLPCIVLTGHGDVPMAVEALKKGVDDFVEKPFDGNALVDKLIAALAVEEERFERERLWQSGLDRLATLSQRERDVMRLLLAGKLNKVIADDLGIAMRTVEVHRARILEKWASKARWSWRRSLLRSTFLSGEIFDGAIVEVVAGSDDLQMPFGN